MILFRLFDPAKPIIEVIYIKEIKLTSKKIKL